MPAFWSSEKWEQPTISQKTSTSYFLSLCRISFPSDYASGFASSSAIVGLHCISQNEPVDCVSDALRENVAYVNRISQRRES
eukprot:scaffold4874_cov78-Cylindrotheca_fusiformis.AAC.2